MAKGKKLRATQHSGRMGIARHNDRHFPLNKAEHIDADKIKCNVYWNCYQEDISFEEAERRFYRENFQEWADFRNLRSILANHPERVVSPSTIYESSQTQPEEVIFQIGDKDTVVSEGISPAILWKATMDFLQWHNENFGDHIKILDVAMHLDETSPHIHMRRAWVYRHPEGFAAVGQTKALKQMGFQLPNPDAKEGRNNNLKMTYTAQCREEWLDILERDCHLNIERTPQKLPLNRQNLRKNDFIIQKQEAEIEDQQQELQELSRKKEDAQVEVKVAVENAIQTYGTPEIVMKKAEEAKKEYGDPEEIKRTMLVYQNKLYGPEGLIAQMRVIMQEIDSLEGDLNQLIKKADEFNAPEFLAIPRDKVRQNVSDGVCGFDDLIAKYNDGHIVKSCEYYPESKKYGYSVGVLEDLNHGLCQLGIMKSEPNIAPQSIVEELWACFDKRIAISPRLTSFIDLLEQRRKVANHIENIKSRGRSR